MILIALTAWTALAVGAFLIAVVLWWLADPTRLDYETWLRVAHGRDISLTLAFCAAVIALFLFLTGGFL